MSEAGTHLAIAQARSGSGAAVRAAASLETQIRAILATVPDPELPVLSVVDLGIVHRIAVDEDGIRVAILPTFIGCPALDAIRTSIASALAGLGRPVRVEITFEVPWTSDRISAAGLRALAAVGIAPPVEPGATRCPFCASASVVMDSAFGPTQCRSLFYCRACRQPFEALKSV